MANLSITYTVYREYMTAIWVPVEPVWKVFWKCSIAMMAVMREPVIFSEIQKVIASVVAYHHSHWHKHSRMRRR